MVSNLYQAGFLISKIQKISRRIFNKKLKEHGIHIHPGQGRILYVLWKHGDGIPTKKLIEKTGLPKTTLSSILDRLEQEGQIKRHQSQDDRRENIIELTPINKSYHEVYDKISKEMEDLYYDGFNDKEKTELDQYLSRILKNLEET